MVAAPGVPIGIGLAAGDILGRRPTTADWRALDASIQGSVELPGATAYDHARRLADRHWPGGSALGQRIRTVIQGNEGDLYLLTDESDGEILRVTPVEG